MVVTQLTFSEVALINLGAGSGNVRKSTYQKLTIKWPG
jgi:hypothetical protein